MIVDEAAEPEDDPVLAPSLMGQSSYSSTASYQQDL